jgi:hypothetical protein
LLSVVNNPFPPPSNLMSCCHPNSAILLFPVDDHACIGQIGTQYEHTPLDALQPFFTQAWLMQARTTVLNFFLAIIPQLPPPAILHLQQDHQRLSESRAEVERLRSHIQYLEQQLVVQAQMGKKVGKALVPAGPDRSDRIIDGSAGTQSENRDTFLERDEPTSSMLYCVPLSGDGANCNGLERTSCQRVRRADKDGSNGSQAGGEVQYGRDEGQELMEMGQKAFLAFPRQGGNSGSLLSERSGCPGTSLSGGDAVEMGIGSLPAEGNASRILESRHALLGGTNDVLSRVAMDGSNNVGLS